MLSTNAIYHPGHAGYVSEFEQFLEEYAGQHPHMEEDQMQGWYLLWDKPVDFDALEKARADTVTVKSYQYE